MDPIHIDNEMLKNKFGVKKPAYLRGILSKIKVSDMDVALLEKAFPSVDRFAYLSQEKTGYCWLISALHFMEYYIYSKYGKTNIRLSKNYLIFWDKIEKANWFLENILELSMNKGNNRAIKYILDRAMSDRGQWNMARNLIEKYGVIPYEIMETSSSCKNTGECNACISMILKKNASELINLVAEGTPIDIIHNKKERMLQEVIEILCSCFGIPPERISSNLFHEDLKITPKEYYMRYIKFPFDEYICIHNDGEISTPENSFNDIVLDGNVVGGEPYLILRVKDNVFLECIQKQISNRIPCWITCDTGKFYFHNIGVFDDSVFNLKQFESSGKLSKKVINQYGIASMSHSLLLVDMAEISGDRWWKAIDSGLFPNQSPVRYISDSWLQKYTFQAVVRKEYLPFLLDDRIKKRTIFPWDLFVFK